MRGIALALLLTLAALALPQDYQYVGEIQSRQYDVPIRNASGSGVAGTERVHLVYKVYLKTVDTDEVKEDAGGPLKCILKCRGNVHAKHEECTPNSCDEPCTKKHERKIRGEYKPNIANMRAARADSGKLARAAGAGLGPDHWSSATSSALRQIKENAESLHTVRMQHSDKACGVLHGWHQLRKRQIWVKGEFRRVGAYISGGREVRRIDQPAGTHEKMIAETWIPDADPSRTDEGWACHCFKAGHKVPQTPAKDGPSRIPSTGKTPTYSGLGWRKPDGTLVIPDPSKVTAKCVGDGISNVHLVIENKSEEDLICTTEPGTVCDPKDPNVQIMCLLAAMDFVIKAGSTVQIPLTEAGVPASEFSLPAACIEMQKTPPKGVTLEMRPNTDDALAALALKASKGLVRGPWDQARVWIYTDKATLAEINERMSPGVTAGQYVDALYDLERIGGVDLSDPKYRRCFELSLLPAEGASADASAWFYSRLAENDPQALITALASPDLVVKLTSGDRARLQQLARMLGAGVGAKSQIVRTNALKLLLVVPQDKRSDVARYGGLDWLGHSLVSSVETEVDLAIMVAVAYKAVDFQPTLAFLVEEGATSAIKQKASEAMKALGG